MIKYFSFIILSLLLFNSSLSFAQKNDKDVVLIVNLFHEMSTGVLGNRDLYLSDEIKSLEKKFPHSQVLLVQANDNKDLHQQLEGIFGKSNQAIRALLVHAHGTSKDLKKTLEEQETHYRVMKNPSLLNTFLKNKSENEKRWKTDPSLRYAVQIGNNVDDWRITLNNDYIDENSFSSGFKAIQDKFHPEAQIIFDSCELLKNVEAKDKARVVQSIAENFGLTSGKIYLNETQGASELEIALKQPFQKQKSPGMKNFLLLTQLLAPVKYPYYLYENFFVDNQGYLAEVRDGQVKLTKKGYYPTYWELKDPRLSELKLKKPQDVTSLKSPAKPSVLKGN